MNTHLDLAVAALVAITDPQKSSMRMRDPNCVRFIASDALDKLGISAGVRWMSHTKVSGDMAAELDRRREDEGRGPA